MLRKKPLKKTAKVQDVFGNKFSKEELDWNKRYNIYQPEAHDMVVSNESAKTVTEFERELKQLNKNLYIAYNSHTPIDEKPFGHAIRFRNFSLPEKYDPVCGVGKGGINVLPAMSKFKHFKNSEGQYESRLEFKGWEAALNQIIEYLVSRNLEVNKF